MLNKTLYLVCIAISFATNNYAQSNIDNILSEIAKNNKSIMANQQYWEAKKLLYKTGLTPDNPTIAYEYLIGTPDGAGIQNNLSIIQSIDFPTAYTKKKQVTLEQIEQDEFQKVVKRQIVLLEAKKHCIELIYLNKRKSELKRRLKKADKLSDELQIMLDNGEVSILDANKIRLEVLLVNNDVRINNSGIKRYRQKLMELNGGNAIVFKDTAYTLIPKIPDFESLEKTIEENDPIIKSIYKQKEIDQKKLELSKALALPKMEGGYHYQSILGQRYQGLHVGISIPIWESKNTV